MVVHTWISRQPKGLGFVGHGHDGIEIDKECDPIDIYGGDDNLKDKALEKVTQAPKPNHPRVTTKEWVNKTSKRIDPIEQTRLGFNTQNNKDLNKKGKASRKSQSDPEKKLSDPIWKISDP